MFMAAIILFLPSAALIVAGGGTVWVAIRGLRRRILPRAVGVLRIIAGVGTLGFAVIALSPFWSDVQYGIVILPIAALIGAALWNALLFGAAYLVERQARSS